MIAEFKAFFDLFKMGKAVSDPAMWKNRTLAANNLGLLLAACAVIAKGFGYDLQIDKDTMQALAGGIAAAVVIFNNIMHVITSKKVGLSPDGETGSPDRPESGGG